MNSEFGFWWRKNPYRVIAFVVILFVVIFTIMSIVLGYVFGWNWVGVGGGDSQVTITALTPGATTSAAETTVTREYLPASLSIGAVWFTAWQNHDREIAEKRAAFDRNIAIDNQREAAVQTSGDYPQLCSDVGESIVSVMRSVFSRNARNLVD